MTRRLGYLVVEGPHDVEFSIRLIQSRAASLSRIKKIEDLDETFQRLVPDKFPHGGDLLKRVPVPVFLQDNDFAIAIHAAGGDSNIATCLEDTSLVLKSGALSAIGVILDSDSKESPGDRHKKLLEAIVDSGILVPSQPGEISKSQPSTGVYVLPDNISQGTLEDLLLECGKLAYPEHLQAATDFVGDIFEKCIGKEFSDLHLPAGKNKAIIGSVAELLKPGKAIQVSIQDNKWLKGSALQIERIKKAADFLAELFSLENNAVEI